MFDDEIVTIAPAAVQTLISPIRSAPLLCVCTWKTPLCPLVVSCKLLLQGDVFTSIAMVSDKDKAASEERKQEPQSAGREIKE